MKRKIFFSWIILSIIFLSLTYASEIIPWDKAQDYYGKKVTVQGKIVSTYNSGRACFLNFHPDYKRYFTAVIFRSHYHLFPPNPEDCYYGKEVQVSGIIKRYKGKPEIILESPSQIRVINQPEDEEVSEVISWKDAHRYYGKFVTVEGTIVASYNSGKACFLNFHRNWKRYFTAVIFSSNFHKFDSAPEQLYQGKKVRVKGMVREYRGKPEIIVNSPSQITIIE